MKTVQIQELKRNLSALVEEAAGGQRILITRHNRPIATLAPAPSEGLRTGIRFGRAQLRPSDLPVVGPGRSIGELLAEDRGDDR